MATSAELLAQVNQSLDALRTDMHDLPHRHLSLKAVFLHSWQLLTARGAVGAGGAGGFPRGFTLPAFVAVSRSLSRSCGLWYRSR